MTKPIRLNSIACAVIYALHGNGGLIRSAALSAYLARSN